MKKQRGIMRRIVDANTRLMSAGYNKLVEEWKANQNALKEKLRFVLKTLTDKDSAYLLCGYNGLKQRALMLNGVGMGDSEGKKMQLIRRLTNQGYNMQVMAANALQEDAVDQKKLSDLNTRDSRKKRTGSSEELWTLTSEWPAVLSDKPSLTQLLTVKLKLL